MNIILIDKKTGKTRSIPLRKGLILAVGVGLLVLGTSLGWLGKAMVSPSQPATNSLTQDLASDVEQSAQVIRDAKREAEERLTALTMRLAEMQARIVRLDALGELLVEAAKLDGGEFDFSATPPVGGPHSVDDDSFERPTIMSTLDQLVMDIEHREQQLEVLDNLLLNHKIQKEIYLTGRPVKWGWMSSRFGRRTDPFTGKLAWHKGVDFAGKEGSEIISVGSGVVTWSADRYGYGLMVEVNHGGGYTTRYGHAKELLVEVGDIVQKGQAIAKMGSTGRSTGPHVHFEVLRHGKAVDPSRYVYRKERK